METEEITKKEFYTIGEVSRITGVHPHVLRYWESRGKLLKPKRRRSRHRLYRPADIQLIFEIKRLREEEKLTLPAMRRQLQRQPEIKKDLPTIPVPPPPRDPVLALLARVKEELLALKDFLE